MQIKPLTNEIAYDERKKSFLIIQITIKIDSPFYFEHHLYKSKTGMSELII